VYVHGHSNLDVSRCVGLNSAATAIIDSYLSECHARGFDSQAIGGWNGPGPFKIVNNYLEGSGENIILGGADPHISNLVPSDIEIRRNHFYKPDSWRDVWTVKNLFELKNAQRVLVEGNVFENNWVDAQGGTAILMWSVNQDGGAPWSVTKDVTFRYNIIRRTPNGLAVTGRGGSVNEPATRIWIVDNLFDQLGPNYDGAAGELFNFYNNNVDLVVEHNTGLPGTKTIEFDGPAASGFVFRYNVVDRGHYGVGGSGTGEGTASLERFATGYTFVGNVLIGANSSAYPDGNFFPPNEAGVHFVDINGGNYRLETSSPYHNIANGRDPGADIDAIEAATQGVIRP